MENNSLVSVKIGKSPIIDSKPRVSYRGIGGWFKHHLFSPNPLVWGTAKPITPSDTEYEGEMKRSFTGNYVPKGYGTLKFNKTGSSYSGEWNCGVFHGKGKFVEKKNGNLHRVYEGKYAYSYRHGSGKTKLWNKRNGELELVHEGSYLFGERQGKGIITYPNGNQYEGMWFGDGNPIGKGIFRYVCGKHAGFKKNVRYCLLTRKCHTISMEKLEEAQNLSLTQSRRQRKCQSNVVEISSRDADGDENESFLKDDEKMK